MEETKEILITRIFKFKEIIDTLTEGVGELDSFEISMPGRIDGNPEWRRFNVANAIPFIRIRFKEPLEKK